MSVRKSSGNSRRILASVGVIGALGILGGVGTYSAFTSTVTAGPQTVSSDTLSLTASGSTFATTAAGIVPGDTIDRQVTLTNGGSAFGSIDFASTAATSSLLDTDATNGLQMQVDKCSVAWTGAAGSALTCGGTTTTVIPSGRVAPRAVTGVTGLSALSASGVDYLRVRLTLPSTADNNFQGKTSVISYTVTGNQRTAGNR